MHDDRDYERGPAPTPVDEDHFSMGDRAATTALSVLRARLVETRVTIDNWEERGYAIVKMTSRDRPKLLFDTVCALTDMQYVVFHGTVIAEGSEAYQVRARPFFFPFSSSSCLHLHDETVTSVHLSRPAALRYSTVHGISPVPMPARICLTSSTTRLVVPEQRCLRCWILLDLGMHVTRQEILPSFVCS